LFVFIKKKIFQLTGAETEKFKTRDLFFDIVDESKVKEYSNVLIYSSKVTNVKPWLCRIWLCWLEPTLC